MRIWVNENKAVTIKKWRAQEVSTFKILYLNFIPALNLSYLELNGQVLEVWT